MSASDTIYVDNNATTPLAPEVLSAMTACLTDCYGNPSSLHHVGAMAKQIVMDARSKVANLLGATPAEIVFTSSATESNHLAILGALGRDRSRQHVVTTVVEHPSTRLLLSRLISEGVTVTEIAVDGHGIPDLAALEAAITPHTALVSMMWANNETGAVLPVAEAAAIAAAHGVLFHTDAVQAVGRVPVDMRQVSADLLSLSGHKLHAAKGIGVLFMRKGCKLPSLLYGHQERGRRGGTENVAAIAGLGVAAELALKNLETDSAYVAALRHRLERGLLQQLPFASVNSGGTQRLANTSNIRFGEIDAEITLDRLDKAGICASSGSACTAGGTEPSHVLLSMGLSRTEALAAVRFSLSRYNTVLEVDRILKVLPDIVRPLAGMVAC
ncbi:cysteine desulfurase family protein [Sulfuriferula nivalis]|uniref:Cysteine desulfurase NifS n=1 Tax=Sulfuriferula nivalis TaxID=2675298 RepID=A0A809RDD7_9PROT|nr:aminotransferase class V-fold PLP-dependent enzyme [Sulfuriferula nivalis]BBO99665.1 cysteine desulfurase NifS [Sulfuriferula nivalis]